MLEQKDKDAVITIRAKPRSKRFSVEFGKDGLTINLKNRAENNRANAELIKELRRILKKDLIMISGAKSKNKKIVIFDATKEEIEEELRKKCAGST